MIQVSRAASTEESYVYKSNIYPPLLFTNSLLHPQALGFFFFIYFFLGLKFTEEFGAIYGKLYFSAILSNSLP